jgi:hypothetical protein
MLCLTLFFFIPRSDLRSAAAGGDMVLLFRWGAKGHASRHPSGPGWTAAAFRTIQGDAQVSSWYKYVLSAAESTHLMLSSLTYVCIVYTHIPQLPGCSKTPMTTSPGQTNLQFIVCVASLVPTCLFWGETGPQVAQEIIFKTSQLTPPCTHTLLHAVHTVSAAV